MDLAGDFLIIGSGIAALRAAAALGLAGQVIVLTKAEPAEGSTGYAQGGIAAAVGDNDSPELHARDTIAAGDGLCDERAVRYPRRGWRRNTCASSSSGARGSIATGRAGCRWRAKALTAFHACFTRATQPAARLAVLSGSACPAMPAVRVIPHALATEIIARGGRAIGVRFWSRWDSGRGACFRDPDRDRRGRPDLP